MSNLVKRTQEMYSNIDELMNRCMSASGIKIDSIADMDDNEVLLCRDCFKLKNEAKQYSLEVAETLDKIDSIDEKLNQLLKNKN